VKGFWGLNIKTGREDLLLRSSKRAGFRTNKIKKTGHSKIFFLTIKKG